MYSNKRLFCCNEEPDSARFLLLSAASFAVVLLPWMGMETRLFGYSVIRTSYLHRLLYPVIQQREGTKQNPAPSSFLSSRRSFLLLAFLFLIRERKSYPFLPGTRYLVLVLPGIESSHSYRMSTALR